MSRERAHLHVQEVDVGRPEAVDDAAPADESLSSRVRVGSETVVVPLLTQVDVQVVVLPYTATLCQSCASCERVWTYHSY